MTFAPHQGAARPRGCWKKVLVATLSVLLAGIAVTLALVPDPVPVEVAEVVRGRIEVTVDEDGRTRVKKRYTVFAPQTGTLERIQLESGDSVALGQVVAAILPMAPRLLDARTEAAARARVEAARARLSEALAGVDRALAEREQAERSARRRAQLYAESIGSMEEAEEAELLAEARREALSGAQAEARAAENELSAARAAIEEGLLPSERLSIRSPTFGRVLRVFKESEGAVQAGEALLELGDPRVLEVVIDVLSADAVHLAVGAPVSIMGWGGETLAGRVERVLPAAVTRLSALGVEEQRVDVIIEPMGSLDPWARLGDGYRVEGSILVEAADGVTKLPASAVFQRNAGWAVFAVREERAKLTPVLLGLRNAREVEVKRGLEPGAKVILYPSDRVSDGVRVETRAEAVSMR